LVNEPFFLQAPQQPGAHDRIAYGTNIAAAAGWICHTLLS
jgi:hypothetical protein